jgi:hypothetical protein
MPLENPLTFYSAYALQTASKLAKYAGAMMRKKSLYWRVKYDPKKMDYMDEAIAPLEEDAVEEDALAVRSVA